MTHSESEYIMIIVITTNGALVELAANKDTIIMTSFLNCFSSLLIAEWINVLNNFCNILGKGKGGENENKDCNTYWIHFSELICSDTC